MRHARLCYNRQDVFQPHPLTYRGVALRGLRCLLPFLYLGLAAIGAVAQTAKSLSIGDAIRNRSDHVAVHLGETLVLTGVVTDEPHDVGSGSSLANLQDATGGIALYGPHALLPPGGFTRGDILEARGKLAQYKGMEELQLEAVRRTGATEPLSPLEVSASKLRGEEYSGKLVRVQGQIILLPNGGIALRDRFGEIPVYMLRSFFQHTSFMQRLLQGGQVEILGLARQRVNDGEPLSSGYLISPRDELDFKFAPLTRYRESAAIALVVLAASSIFGSAGGRRKEGRARWPFFRKDGRRATSDSARWRAVWARSSGCSMWTRTGCFM